VFLLYVIIFSKRKPKNLRLRLLFKDKIFPQSINLRIKKLER